MTAGTKFIFTALLVFSLLIVYRVAPGATIVTAILLLALAYVYLRRRDGWRTRPSRRFSTRTPPPSRFLVLIPPPGSTPRFIGQVLQGSSAFPLAPPVGG
jgi:hypothetical protein